MARQKHTAEQIVSKLREAEVLQEKGMPMEEVAREYDVTLDDIEHRMDDKELATVLDSGGR